MFSENELISGMKSRTRRLSKYFFFLNHFGKIIICLSELLFSSF
jgi:hypothetical protein